MATIRNIFHRLFHGVLATGLGILVLGGAGCLFGSGTPKQTMTTSPENTSGQGTVEASLGDNGNTNVDVRVKHLSPAIKVEADASVYVVWIQARNAAIQNVGALQVDDDLIGKFKTTTPHRAFTLSITPEPSARMALPTHRAVFTSEVNRVD